jgi:hypothetical protein
MIDVRHGPLRTQDEPKRQLDFLARWKAKKYLVYSEDAIELDGYPVLNPEGRFSKEQIRRINTAILNQVPESGCAKTPAPRPAGAAMEIGGKVIEQIV